MFKWYLKSFLDNSKCYKNLFHYVNRQLPHCNSRNHAELLDHVHTKKPNIKCKYIFYLKELV